MSFQVVMLFPGAKHLLGRRRSYPISIEAFDAKEGEGSLSEACGRNQRVQLPAFQTATSMDPSRTCPEIPQQYLCPISLQIMTGPVFCIHGEEAAAADHLSANTSVYDFDSICDWLKRGGLYDPLTGTKLEDVITLRPHLSLQREIQEWCAQNNIEYAPRVWRRQEAEATGANKDTKTWTVGGVLKAVGKFLFSQHPHPYDAYHYAVCA